MKYLIDGYNLAHQITLPAGKVSPARLDAARSELLALIANSHGNDIGNVTIIFDTKRSRNVETEQVIYGIDVRFAVGEEADDVIERLIQAHATPKRLVVVSDDHRVQAAGRRRSCRVIGCRQYLDELERKQRPARLTELPHEKPTIIDSTEANEWLNVFRDADTKPAPRAKRNEPRP